MLHFSFYFLLYTFSCFGLVCFGTQNFKKDIFLAVMLSYPSAMVTYIVLLLVALPLQTWAQGYALHATANCGNLKIIADGIELASLDEPTNFPSTDDSGVLVPSDTTTIEIRCRWHGPSGGILASADNGLKTDDTWTCSSDSGATWKTASFLDVKHPYFNRTHISKDAKVIWFHDFSTSNSDGNWTAKGDVICKTEVEPCLSGWTSLSTGCYRFLPESGDVKKLDDAVALCENQGGYLVEINSQEEHNALQQFNQDHGNGEWVWLGATDRDKEGEWRWIHSGQIMSFNAWDSGEPNDAGDDEDCLIAWWNGGQWNDISCQYTYTGHKALCEYKAEGPTCPKIKTVGEICYERIENGVDTSSYGCTENCIYKIALLPNEEKICFKSPGEFPVTNYQCKDVEFVGPGGGK